MPSNHKIISSIDVNKNIALNGFGYQPNPSYWRRRRWWQRFKRLVLLPSLFSTVLLLGGCENQAVDNAMLKIAVDTVLEVSSFAASPSTLDWLISVGADTLEFGVKALVGN